MAGMGPPPKPAGERRRRNATVAMTQLPAEGRQGDPPRYPLPPIVVKDDDGGSEMAREREADLWESLWATPQAVMWERTHAELTVARFVRFSVLAETGNVKAATEARQLEDRLGLNPQAMLRLRWEVAADEMAEQRQERSTRTAKKTARQRLRVVDSDAVAGS
ncbi:phage terminase small subunit [Streptomyces sp. NPDC003857]